MSEEQKKNDGTDADLLAPPGPSPRPWAYILVGLGGAIVLGISALVLMRGYILSRPLDLLNTSAALGDHIVEVLKANLVPESGIKRSEPQLREEPACRWYHYDFEVTLPPQMNIDGMRSLLVQGLAERRARVSNEDPLEFSLGPYPFAKVSFSGGASGTEPESAPETTAMTEPAPTEGRELRIASLALARTVSDALIAAGVPADKMAAGDPSEEEDDQAVWMRTQIQLTDWSPPSVDALVGAIATAAAQEYATVSRDGAAKVEVSLEGCAVVEVDLGGEAPPAAPTPMPVPSPTPAVPATPAPTSKQDLRPACLTLAQEVRDGLAEAGIARDAVVSQPDHDSEDTSSIWKLVHLQVRGGTALPPEDLLAATMKHVGGPPAEGSVDSSAGPPELHYRLNGHLCAIVELQPSAAETPAAHNDEMPTEISPEGQHEGELGLAKGDPAHPKVAIILDDGGNNESVGDAVLKLSPSLTLSILPHLKYSRDIAERGAKLGFEIMLHQPMEPLKEVAKDPGLLKVGMGADEIASITAEDIAEVPGISGINNHKGSKFTSDPASMALFFQGIKGKPYYFIDSVTIGNSKAYDMAKTAGFKAAKRSVFLDDKSDAAYIRKQFGILHAKAKKTGSAIAIGHFRPSTVAQLPDELAMLKREGITLVHASELTQ